MYSIAIIDDEKEISSGFAQFFPWNELGFTVEASFSGAREAMEYLLSHPVDVVVSDVIMPEMSGIELARAIHEANLPQKPLVVLFSAYEKFEYAREALHYHCADYMLKEMGFDELKEAFIKLRRRLDEERGAGETQAVEDQIIQTMQRYVARDPVSATLEGASQAVYLSPAYASRYFKQRTGVGFADYVIQQKMRLAAELLAQPQYKIYEISEQVGYSNSANFARTFRKYYQLSPQDYRFQVLGRTVSEEKSELIP